MMRANDNPLDTSWWLWAWEGRSGTLVQSRSSPAGDVRRADESLSKASALLSLPKEHEETRVIIMRMEEPSGQRSGRSEIPERSIWRILQWSWYLKAIIWKLVCVRFQSSLPLGRTGPHSSNILPWGRGKYLPVLLSASGMFTSLEHSQGWGWFMDGICKLSGNLLG